MKRLSQTAKFGNFDVSQHGFIHAAGRRPASGLQFGNALAFGFKCVRGYFGQARLDALHADSGTVKFVVGK